MIEHAENPYQPPSSQQPPEQQPSRSKLRTACAVLNLAFALCIFSGCLNGLVFDRNVGLIGFIFVAIGLFVAYCEWLVLARHNHLAEYRLGVASILLGILAGYVSVIDLFNVMSNTTADQLNTIGFTLGLLLSIVVPSYLIGTGWMRLRWTHDALTRHRSTPTNSRRS